MQTMVDILTFIGRINRISGSFKAKISFSILVFISSSVELSIEMFYKIRPRGYKPFPMLNSAEHEIYPAHKC